MITVNNISMCFIGKDVLNNVSFQVKAGEALTVKGKNGVGKSTLLKICSGLIKPSSGEVKVDDLVVHKNKSEVYKNLGFSVDDVLIDKLSIVEYLDFICRLFNIEKGVAKERIVYWLDFFELEDQNVWIENCSQGMRQKVSLITALIHNPENIILDEPFVHLDIAVKAKFQNKLSALVEKGVTLLLSSHEENVSIAKSKVLTLLPPS